MLERLEMEAFLTLAEELHFSRTAERLQVTPGRISQTIKKLERRLGGPLFERTSRQVTLTPLGEHFRDELLPGYQQIQNAVTNTRAAADGLTGVLRVSFTTSWNGNLLLCAVDEFNSRYPGCIVEIYEETLHAAFEMLRTGEVDLLVGEVFFTDGSDITVGPTVFSSPRALVVPADHLLAARETVSVEDFALAPLIRPGGFPGKLLDRNYPQRTPSGRPVPSGSIAYGWQEMLTLIGADKGVTIVSLEGANFYGRSDVAFVPFHDAPPIDYALMWRTGQDTATVQAFVSATLEVVDARTLDPHSDAKGPRWTGGGGRNSARE
ncbi:LysR family transcriptional regulator [Nonomuraea insulae]|uniref:LysR family transcriptional regulator n=1 Tax=Nonomuraea insulae TaxID=1616787 RepID=A0ABW1D8I4_9ACTN